MNNYKLIIQYDGTNYAGWQVQNNAMSVQQKLIDSIAVILKERVNLVGAGRTDTGVHALGQTANFRTEMMLDLYKFSYQLNSILPKDISITGITEAPIEFHSRFDAKKRSYMYFISKFKSPFYNKYTYRYKGLINISRLNKLSQCFLGVHNFTSFSKKNSDTLNKVCNIYNAWWKETRGMVIFYIEADRFLHGMVRTVTGTLLNTAKEGLSEEHIQSLFEANDRSQAAESVPGNGLFLYKVKY